MDFSNIKNIEELQQMLNRQKDIANRTPREDFDNLCPLDMYNILYHPFSDASFLQFNENSASAVEKMPFMQLIFALLEKVEQAGELKLTAKGNLPTKLVKELYDLGIIKDDFVERGYQKVYKESDVAFITNLKIMCNLAGITKIRNKKLSLTQKGKKLWTAKNRFPLFKEIFMTYGYKFNLGYHDGYQIEGVQRTLSYTLFQLLKNGQEERPLEFYSEKVLRAYPHILAEMEPSPYRTPQEHFTNCYDIRIMQRFLAWFDLVELRMEKIAGSFRENVFVKTGLLDQVIRIDDSKFLFLSAKNRT